MSLAVLLNSNRNGLFTGKKVIIIPNQAPSWLSKFWFIWVLPHHFFAHPCIFPGYQALVACCHDNLLSQDCRWLQRQSDFPQRTAGPTFCCCDKKGLQTSSPMEIQHGDQMPPLRTVQRAWSVYHHQLKMYSTKYYQSQRRGEGTPQEDLIWPRAKLKPKSCSSFLLQGVFLPFQKHLVDALCWQSMTLG